jgi:hypothetical protein
MQVHVGKQPGVYCSWPEAEAQVRGFRNAKHKSFQTRAEAFGEADLQPGPASFAISFTPRPAAFAFPGLGPETAAARVVPQPQQEQAAHEVVSATRTAMSAEVQTLCCVCKSSEARHVTQVHAFAVQIITLALNAGKQVVQQQSSALQGSVQVVSAVPHCAVPLYSSRHDGQGSALFLYLTLYFSHFSYTLPKYFVGYHR